MNKLIICICLFACIYSIDMNAAVRHLINHAHATSTHYCAAYVADALEAGGFRFTRQASAYMYRTNGILKGIGYNEISKPSSFKKGDITVTDRNNAHPHGHMAMWSGSNWISDFVQRSEYVYGSNQPKVHYFRYGSGGGSSSSKPSGSGSSSGSSSSSSSSSGGCKGKSVNEIAREVIRGKWGNGNTRVNKLRSAGCDPSAVQREVNRILS